MSFQEFAGNARLTLRWSSTSTPSEIIDVLNTSGNNNPDGNSAFTDIVKGARNTWEPVNGVAPTLDANGWPMGDATFIFQESLNQGLDLDPLMSGRIQFQFTGKADVSLFGNVSSSSLSSSYSSLTNTTTGSFLTNPVGSNASSITLRNSRRDGQPNGPRGFTDLKLMRPISPNATTNYSPSSIFTTQMKEAFSRYTVVRFQYVGNQQLNWSDRTMPSYFNQNNGTRTAATYNPGWDNSNDNGWSWEHKILFANEMGRDLMLSIPPLASGKTIADAQSYMVKLAQLIRFGSDGVNPYTAPTANPVYPPLNPNLRVYFEIGNELWNSAGVFYTDYFNIDRLAENVDAAENAALTYDGVTDMGQKRYRYIMLRTKQMSDIFRGVFGDGALPGNGNNENARIRPVYQWQYDNANGTAEKALTWADNYFNKADPASPYTGTPIPIKNYLWGAGGAAYYGAKNGNGLTEQVPNSGFDTTTVPTGYNLNPAGTSWTFTGTAGIARSNGADIPPAFNGAQVGYVTDTGRMTVSFTVPSTQTSNLYAVAFKALNRKATGSSTADKQNLRVYLNYGTANQIDLTAKTFSQSNGYTPPSYDQIGNTWNARNVFWTNSQYYYTKSVPLAPGSTHTLTILGRGDITGTNLTNQTAFIDDFRLTSVDAIFAGGIPGGGEATGQPTGQNLRNSMTVSNNWAAAYGLKHIAYESGWSLGGDDGGSYVQLNAKYGDARTLTAQKTFMDFYTQAGGAVNVFGTYAQWPSWSDYYAEQGLLNVNNYPIIQGVNAASNSLEVEPTNGQYANGQFNRTTASLGWKADLSASKINNAGGWIQWNILAPRTGRYVLSASTATGGNAALLIDDTIVANGTSGGTLTSTVALTQGLHTVRVRAASGSFVVNSITVVSENAPTAPALTGLSEQNLAVTLQ
ncbi:MAG: hypothetical protein ACRCZF_05440, partial [Gemmataceae bacterium]